MVHVLIVFYLFFWFICFWFVGTEIGAEEWRLNNALNHSVVVKETELFMLLF